MEQPAVTTSPRLRADAARNRERLLAAAAAVFGAGGAESSLEAVAREAGVGIGTLYRHFPTREALFEAVYRREVDQVADLAGRLTEGDPVEALRAWLHATVNFVATKKGMATALAIALSSTSELTRYSSQRLTEAAGGLLRRAVRAGAIRGDLAPEDLLRAMVGMCTVYDQPGWKDSVLRLVDILVEGLRVHRP
jgi:AcrR family transcriptional regulator